MSSLKRFLVVVFTLGAFAGGIGCDVLKGGKTEKASKAKDSDDDDDDDDKKKKKKKKKKSKDDEEEDEDEGTAKGETDTASDDVKPPTPVGESFAGLYRSTWGDTRMKQTGNIVTATYPGGTLNCIATGKDLDCDWKDTAGVGKAKLAKLANGDIDGTWGFGASATAGGGRWLFTLKQAGDPGTASTDAQSGEFAGVYISTWGDTTFKEEGGRVTGRYPSGTLDCTPVGAQLDCTWREGGSYGKASLTRQANGNLSGTWGNGASATNGGSWLFRKK